MGSSFPTEKHSTGSRKENTYVEAMLDNANCAYRLIVTWQRVTTMHQNLLMAICEEEYAVFDCGLA